MKGFSVLLLGFFLVWGLCCRSGGRDGKADLILVEGKVWTGNPGRPFAEAVAVKHGEIVDVGSSAEIGRESGSTTDVVRLDGALVLPGFTDSHTHFLEGGFSLSRLQLQEADSKESLTALVRERAAELEAGEWILGGNWDHQRFDPPVLPRKEWIDGVTPSNPVLVHRLDGHMALANSMALDLAGITRDTPSPPGGEIVRGRNGKPTGILKDAAMDLVARRVPPPSLEERVRAAEAALREAGRFGITSVHDMDYAPGFEVYQKLFREGRLTARIYVYLPVSEVELLQRLKLHTPFGNDFLKIAGVKGFVDGSLGSSTALFFEPYADDASESGLLAPDMIPEGIMEQRLGLADEVGIQAAVHAIGDRANHIILDIYAGILESRGVRDRRWRIEHAQHLLVEDMRRMAALGVIASVQPAHAVDDGCWAEGKIGKKRVRTTYAFRSLIDRGVLLAFGSDWPVASLDPLEGVYAAVTRRTRDGKNPGGWVPEEKITIEEALLGYTRNPAYMAFAEDRLGTLEKGKRADIVVLDRDLFLMPPEKIREAEVLMTVVDGKIVYRR